MRIVVSLLTLCIVIFNTGCQTNTIDTETPLEDSSSPIAPPTQGESSQMTPTSTSPSSGLDSLIEKAKADLAQRLVVLANEIGLIEARSVTWPDSSLGCPQEGMAYTQVLTPGYLILLEHGGSTFEYHANSRGFITTCENPYPPVPDSPDSI